MTMISLSSRTLRCARHLVVFVLLVFLRSPCTCVYINCCANEMCVILLSHICLEKEEVALVHVIGDNLWFTPKK